MFPWLKSKVFFLFFFVFFFFKISEFLVLDVCCIVKSLSLSYLSMFLIISNTSTMSARYLLYLQRWKP